MLVHTSTKAVGEQRETFPPPGSVGAAECGRQTGFHTPLLGRVEPLVNSPGSEGRALPE